MIEVKLDQNELKALMSKLDRINVSKRPPLLVDALRQASLIIEQKMKLEVTEKSLNVRSGRLRSSLESKVNRETMSAVIGSGVRTGARAPYANIQETGGTIVPKKAKWLTIPLDANKTARGVMRFNASDVIESGGFFREVNGNLFLFAKQGKAITPMFILKKQVQLKPSHYLSNTERATRVIALQKMNEIVERGLSK
ncbi:MAG: hypothetical protein M0P69_04410 [Bacteroidales bacterium]|nr:hypothetical protein [Bacteroidales bacterium]